MRKEVPSWWRMHPEEDAARRPHASVKAEVDGLDRFLRLETRSRVLEVGCGSGRYALEIARRGHRVLGCDSNERALAAARAAAKGESLNLHFLKGDPRAIPYRADFDAVVWLDSAFGQLDSDRDDLRALEASRKALKVGGRLLIDSINKEWLMRHFEPNFWERGEGKGSVVLDQVSFDFERGRLENRRTIVAADGRRTPARQSLRVYALTELKVQLERAGLVYRQCWGGLDGSAYGMDSPRLVVLAERGRDEKKPRRVDDGLPTAIRIKGRR